MLPKILSQLIPFFILISMIIGSRTTTAMDNKMQAVHDEIEEDYASVDHLNFAEFEELESEDFIIFDVRKKSEYLISHLQEAIQVEPNISTDDFIEKYSERFAKKTIIFYCSVGRRSSELAERIDAALNENGFAQVYNLEGGIFEWHNTDRPLINHQGPTKEIHPYNRRWGKLINQQKYISY